MPYRKYFVFALCLFTQASWAKQGDVFFEQTPWFTGPLLAPSASITPLGHGNIEAYLYVADSNANYDRNWKRIRQDSFWSETLQIYNTFGLTSFMAIDCLPTVVLNECKGSRSFLFSDFSVGFDFQLVKSDVGNWPVKLGVRETFPTGKFQHGNPQKHNTDFSGFGAYATELILSTVKIVRFRGAHWLILRGAVQYIAAPKVHVRGYSIYGGGRDTNGYIYPPQNFSIDLAFEFSFTQRWAIASDFAVNFATKRKFNGYCGYTLSGSVADLTKGAAISCSVAPAIEYNLDENNGFISGVWFTVAGRNSLYFVNWTTAYNFVF